MAGKDTFKKNKVRSTKSTKPSEIRSISGKMGTLKLIRSTYQNVAPQ